MSEEVGSVAEEAAKLFGALQDFAKERGGDLGTGAQDLASQAAAAFGDASSHFATGTEDCKFCPVCRVVHVVRECSPEVRTHLALAAANLMQAAAAVLNTAVPGEGAHRADPVQKIDLDDTSNPFGSWPDEPAAD